MGIERFAEEICERLQGQLVDVKNITVRQVMKNNSINLTALVFENELSNMAPTLYLDGYYRQYEASTDMSVIIERIIGVYEKSRVEKEFDVSSIRDWNKVKSMVAYKLINRKRNKQALKNMPHREVLDLEMVFYISLEQGTGSIMIHNNLMDMWGISEDELVKAAEENTPCLFPLHFGSLKDFCEELSGEEVAEGGRLYVLTNDRKEMGAAVMLYPDCLKNIAEELKTDIYIIPSSIHETLILPRTEESEAEVKGMANVIHTINLTALDPEEILGDWVYLYDKETHEISVLEQL